MTLTPGARLGAYEVLSLLGRGGMGEVYRARDTKLNRDVALKILPPELTHDPERVARFRREAQVLASLNHPHIAAIYGLEERQVGQVGQVGPPSFLVLELVEGPTLADRIARGPVPLEEALPIARQIAEALEAAHEKGIVHRDLKPANIALTANDQVKVLDFGLAKALEAGEPGQASGPGGLANSPTITTPAMTRMGMILGTAAYMSPEQAKGRAADRRSDVWAFGCVVYEMLTGTRAFDGDDVSETLAFVLTKEPDWTRLPTSTPAAIGTLLRRCLRKDRARRLDSAAAARLEIDEAGVDAATASAPTPPPRSTTRLFGRFVWTAVGVLLAAGIGFVASPTTRREGSPPVLRFQIQPPPGETFFGQNGVPRFSVSPDGTSVVYVAGLPGKGFELWLRRLDTVDARALVQTDAQLEGPFWSPDSQSIGFFDQSGKLQSVGVRGGAVRTIGDLSGSNNGGSWNKDGVILVATSATGGLQRVSASGGTPVPVTTLDTSRKEMSHRWPQFLPDGRHFLYHVETADGDPAAVYLGSIESSDRKQLVESGSMALFAPPNLLLYLRGESLMAQVLDLNRFELTGDVTLVADSVMRATNGRVGMSASNGGLLVYAAALGLESSQVVWKDRSGKSIKLTGLTLSNPSIERMLSTSGLRLSPDGKRIALAHTVGPSQAISIYDDEREVSTRLTTDAFQYESPVWSPDGSRMIVRSGGGERIEGLYELPIAGASPPRLLLKSESLPGPQEPLDWSSDGQFLVFSDRSGRPPVPTNLWVLPLTGDRKPVPYLVGPFNKRLAALSPNRRWLAYDSDESGGTTQVVIQSFPDPSGGKQQVSSTGGMHPRWRRDGGELFYLDVQGRMTAVPVKTDGRLEVGASTPLFDVGVSAIFRSAVRFDVTADGQRFVMALPRSANPVALTVVTNWTADLKK